MLAAFSEQQMVKTMGLSDGDGDGQRMGLSDAAQLFISEIVFFTVIDRKKCRARANMVI